MSYVLNGEFVYGDSVAVGIRSEGLNFGMGVFETIKILEGKPCFLAEHHKRISGAALELFLVFELSLDGLRSQILELCASNEIVDGAVKVLCYDNSGGSNVLIIEREFAENSGEPLLLNVSDVVRSSRSVVVLNKTLNYAENILELGRSQAHGYDDCLFLNEHGSLTEGSVANLFFIADGKLKTPLVSCGLLEGVIRNRVLEIAEEFGFLVEEGSYPLNDLREADAVFMTNSLRGISEVRRIEFGDKAVNYLSSSFVKRLSIRLKEVEVQSL